MLERQLERFFSQECKRLNIATIKLHLRFSTGWPDRLIILNKKVWWIELKTLTGSLSPRQHAVHDTLKSLNHKVLVLRTKEEITNVLESASLSNESSSVSSRKRIRSTVAGSRTRKDKYNITGIEDLEGGKSN